MQQSWQQRFGELKGQFISRSAERLKALSALLEDLKKNPNDANIIRALMQHFHWLAGSGGIYDLQQISKLGSSGEAICQYMLDNSLSATRFELEKFTILLDCLKAVFSGQAALTYFDSEAAETLASKASDTDVLVLENNQANLLVVTRLLEEAGLAVRSFRMMSTGIQAMMEQVPKAVILSLPLPDGTGYPLVEQLRATPGGDRPPVIILGKESGFINKVKAIHCGADVYFDGSHDWKEVVEKLKSLLYRNRPSLYRILAVEDDPDQAEFIRATLESAGYRVQCLGQPEHFEEVFVSFQPDLILLDVLLGSITGHDLSRYIRQDDQYATLPIIFLTTQNQLATQIASFKAGGDDHLVKPVTPLLLLAAVAGKLERARIFKAMIDHDSLTKVLTYSAFMTRADGIVSHGRANNQTGLLMMDLDNFKAVNERFGFAAADKVLVTLADLLRLRLRRADAIGRIGGDDFAVIIEDLNEDMIVELAAQLLEEFSNFSHLAGNTFFHVTFSAAVSMLGENMSLASWFGLAEGAVKAAKQEGGKQVMRTTLRR